MLYTVVDNLDRMKMCGCQITKRYSVRIVDQIVIRLNIKIEVLHARKLATKSGIQQFS